MRSIDLSVYGIEHPAEIIHNPSYDLLYSMELDKNLQGYERGVLTNLGAVNVDTGIFTGRSPKDKYVVKDQETAQHVWRADPSKKKSSDNHVLTPDQWDYLKEISAKQLSGKKLFVTDAYCGANEDTRIKVRFVAEVAWQAHFVKNMFIRPTEKELETFEPDFVVLVASKTQNDKWKEMGLHSEVYAAFNPTKRMAVIGGTWYGGEMKKGIFSMMNYFLPLRGIAAMHCSANMGKKGDVAIFFGLSGTGKTTLSADPHRALIGDDEHGWDDNGVFNFEGGCYAKCIDLDPKKEPDIYQAIRRDALLENLDVDPQGHIDFHSKKKTENTRVSYPIYHIDNIVKPISRGGHAQNVIFLTADAFGVLPPVSKLTPDQMQYHFLSGFTAKLAGTERGITEPQPTFSSCFGQAFLLLHPTEYARELVKKMKQHNSKAYLVNTGWIGGAYGVGKRIDLPATRAIINAILDGALLNVEYDTLPIFNLQVPRTVPGVDSKLLNPQNAWADPKAWEEAARSLAAKFIENFKNFTDNEAGQKLVAAGPQL